MISKVDVGVVMKNFVDIDIVYGFIFGECIVIMVNDNG